MTAHISSVHQSQSTPDPIEGRSQELVDVLHKIVQNASALIEISNCSVALLDTTGNSLITLAAVSKQGQKSRQTRFHMNEGVAGWVAKHREALVINNVSVDLRFKRLGRIPIGSIACVPLLDGDQFIGTLTASSQEIQAFSARKMHMLTIFAEQAVLAITNARQAELAQRQANQLEMLLDLSRGITTRFDSEALNRTILADLRRLVYFELAVMYHYNDSAQELYPVADLEMADETSCGQDHCLLAVNTQDVQRDKISLQNMTSVSAWAAIHRHPMLHAPSSTGEQSAETSEPEKTAAGDEAEMAAPLISKDVLYGVISLRRPQAFTSEELRLVRNLSNMAAAALENLNLFHTVSSDQQQLRAIVDSSSDGIAITGADTCFIEANAAFGHIFGIEPERLTGMECMELLGYDEEHVSDVGDVGEQPLAADNSLARIQQAMQEQQALPYIEVEIDLHGKARTIGLSITPVSVPNKPLCLIIARDVTAIRDASRMKANFLSMITHELRSPINAIHGYLDLTLTGIAGELNEQQREFVQRARASSEHLYALVEDLLLVSRADSGQVRLNREIISLQEVAANAIEELELMAKDNNITINVEIAPQLQRIYADPVRMQQVLRNLINNALRFSPPGSVVDIIATITNKESETGYAATHASQEDREERLLKLQVRDHGYGIDPEHQPFIFDRFYQAPQGAAGRSSGQGLGLAIVKMVIELHGGTVTVESTPGQGSAFTCLLPCLLS